ncbi:hypothetical protein QFC24_005703 [Naganishia onofrii]|uniref:Uncharacterized protein n=1 Tax=Naganishia onofrii TaxID=1851511 RepID=A0ACC2X5Y9_9TREE|nr:hypothetical protein QFC24_005703 [Naganishia onofrii]
MNSPPNSRFPTTVESGSRTSQGGHDTSARTPLPFRFGPTGPTLKLNARHVERATKTYSNLVKDAATQFKRQIFDAVGGSDRNGKFNTPVPLLPDNGSTCDFEKKCDKKYREVCGKVSIWFQHTVYYKIIAAKKGRSSSSTVRDVVEMDDKRKKVKDLETALETEAAKYEVVMWITEDGKEIEAELRLKEGAQASQEVVKSAADDKTEDDSGAV